MKNQIEEIYSIVIQSKGVSIDSRTLKPGQVFFALTGDNFDGSKFTEQALLNGALKAVVSDINLKARENIIYVENVLATLQEIARIHRLGLNIPVIALTGTNGKTTTKELINHLLSSEFNTLCTLGNLNNHIGVPLTLLNINESHQIAIIEMGASGPGEIMDLCKIALPTHGLITSIGKAHLQGFGNIETIVKTKTELYEFIKKNNGHFFFNTSVKDIYSVLQADDFKSAELFDNHNFRGNNIASVESTDKNMFLNLKITDNSGKIHDCETSVYGQYNFDNIVNACKIADHFQVKPEALIKSLVEFIPSNNRSQIIDWNDNTLILDAYNANPTSVREAVLSFVKISDSGNKVIILGDMLELGETSIEEHIKVISELMEKNFYSQIFLVGPQFKAAGERIDNLPQNCKLFENSTEAKSYIDSIGIKKSLILAKGSRGIKIETIFL